MDGNVTPLTVSVTLAVREGIMEVNVKWVMFKDIDFYDILYGMKN